MGQDDSDVVGSAGGVGRGNQLAATIRGAISQCQYLGDFCRPDVLGQAIGA